MTTQPQIKPLLLAWLQENGMRVAIFGLMLLLFGLYVVSEKNTDHANNARQNTLLLSEELRQSSDNLTRMARTYVVTGDPIYKKHFEEIISIRDGLLPRPVDYHNSYWDLVLAHAPHPRQEGPSIPLLLLMQRAGFTSSELAKLTEAKTGSDALVLREREAMALVEGAGEQLQTRRAQAIEQLHNLAFHQAKAKVMRPIIEVNAMAEARTLAAVHQAEQRARNLRLSFIACSGLLMLLLWRSQRRALRLLGGSPSAVHAHMTRLGRGDFSEMGSPKSVPEHSVLGWLAEAQTSLAQLQRQREEITQKNARLSHLYQALSQCNQAIVRCKSEDELFEQVCEVVVRYGGMKMAWVAVLAEDGVSIRAQAAFGTGTDYVNALHVSINANDPSGRGPIGTAYREDRPFWCQDFQHANATLPWQQQGQRFGWASSAALPLHRSGKVVAILALYADVVDAFDEATQNLLQEMEMDIDYALSHLAQIQQRKMAEDRIQHLAHFDALTQLPNRVELHQRAEYALSLAQRSQCPVALMFLDLDHFKDINDSLGHSVGDALLVELAQRLHAVLREEDIIARLGGDEFIFLLYDIDATGAGMVAQKLLDVLEQPFRVEGNDLSISGSIGIAMYPNDGLDLESLSQRADAAMYQVKKDGRSGYHFFTPEMQARSARHLQLVNALRQALEQGQFQLHYQPQVSLADHRILGAEVLLRWHHPELGWVFPAEFVPAAEDCGLIVPIGAWVLRQAVRQAQAWVGAGLQPITIAVNVSAVQFRQPGLPALISQILQEENWPAALLELELTEGVAMHDPQRAIAVMHDLHQRDIRLSIDDFGTGYSSLSYLKQFKVYKLKIDQSFVRDISTDPDDRAIVRAVIQMAQSLGLQTIAEGVETSGQWTFLQEQGCNEVQGYYYSKPLPAEAFFALARQRQTSEFSLGVGGER